MVEPVESEHFEFYAPGSSKVRSTTFTSTNVAIKLIQRPLTIWGSITVQLTSCLTGLDSTKKVNMFLIQHKQSDWIQTICFAYDELKPFDLFGQIQTSQIVGQPYSDTVP